MLDSTFYIVFFCIVCSLVVFLGLNNSVLWRKKRRKHLVINLIIRNFAADY